MSHKERWTVASDKKLQIIWAKDLENPIRYGPPSLRSVPFSLSSFLPLKSEIYTVNQSQTRANTSRVVVHPANRIQLKRGKEGRHALNCTVTIGHKNMHKSNENM